jgi:hypothetical protein
VVKGYLSGFEDSTLYRFLISCKEHNNQLEAQVEATSSRLYWMLWVLRETQAVTTGVVHTDREKSNCIELFFPWADMFLQGLLKIGRGHLTYIRKWPKREVVPNYLKDMVDGGQCMRYLVILESCICAYSRPR